MANENDTVSESLMQAERRAIVAIYFKLLQKNASRTLERTDNATFAASMTGLAVGGPIGMLGAYGVSSYVKSGVNQHAEYVQRTMQRMTFFSACKSWEYEIKRVLTHQDNMAELLAKPIEPAVNRSALSPTS
jgi:hypothetical protein